ncbi:hypothetical protein EDB69_0687 [Vibrio crassostreae]|uniref:hypothetical protein n=1 Tax=Vibrio crassostreae TaxID=246167 RepID=UPI000F4F1348|nr:hypothetical protein [Vibrio crassostreae]ROO76025.1 hypothetical protein EDB64_1009 [Vibrio crassostreae]ROP14032.1 hypothetical protein EDB63_1038 [Vibrio crassostreae]ROQ88120.1 hypothetical protein EDB72_1676 [Vibrio crassostreae]RPE94731.1 hypothetical protein EDB68_0764 [Vibrio crassostreae]RPF06197.1 hypothetical protein EDB17_0658 [Vibrio crassostreae]
MMTIQLEPIAVTCLFCDSTLVCDDEKTYAENDLLECPSCLEDNLFGEVMEIATEKARKAATEYALKSIAKSLNFNM